jgi:hypothetical protein
MLLARTPALTWSFTRPMSCSTVGRRWLRVMSGCKRLLTPVSISPSRRNEVVEHWCLEPGCQSDPDTARNSQSVAPGLPLVQWVQA